MQAQAFTRERKLTVAECSVHLLITKYGIVPEDIIIEMIPYVKTVLGIFNISFSLPANAREIVNSVFLYTAGEGIMQHSEEAKRRGEFFKAHAFRRSASK